MVRFYSLCFALTSCFSLNAYTKAYLITEDMTVSSSLRELDQDSYIQSDTGGALRSIQGIVRPPEMIGGVFEDGIYPHYLSVIKGTTRVASDVLFKNINIEVHSGAGIVFEEPAIQNDFKVTLYGANLGFVCNSLEGQKHTGPITLQWSSQIELLSTLASPSIHLLNTITDVVFAWGRDLSANCELTFKGPGTHGSIALSGSNFWGKGTVIDQVSLDILHPSSFPIENTTKFADGVLCFRLPEDSTYFGIGNMKGSGTLKVESGSVDLYGDLEGLDLSLEGGTLALWGQNSKIQNVFLRDTGSLEIFSFDSLGDPAIFLEGGVLRVRGDSTASSDQIFSAKNQSTVSLNKGAICTIPHMQIFSGDSTENSLHIQGEGELVIQKVSFQDVRDMTFKIRGSLNGQSGLEIVDLSNTNKLILEGLHFFSGNTLVEGGTLCLSEGASLYANNFGFINIQAGSSLEGCGLGSFANADVLVNGTLSGELVVTGEVICDGGTLAPGNRLGEILVGDAFFSSDSILLIHVDGKDSSLLTVLGELTIEKGSSIQFDTGAQVIFPGETFSFLTWESREGAFDVSVNDSIWRSPKISYGEGIATVFWEYDSLEKIASFSQAKRVGRVFDRALALKNSSLLESLNFLVPANKNQINDVLMKMQPSLYKAAIIQQQNSIVSLREALSSRLQNILDNSVCLGESRQSWSIWADGIGESFSQKATKEAGGYHGNMGGAVLGADYHFNNPLYLGLLGAYTSSFLDFSSDQGGCHTTSGYGGIYLSYLDRKSLFYGNLSFLGSQNHFTESRNLFFPDRKMTALNQHGGNQFLSHLDFGINLSCLGLLIRPFNSFDFILENENSFTESGAGIFNLKVKKSYDSMLRNELGLSLSKCYKAACGEWSIAPMASWVREMRVKGSTYKVSFKDFEEIFTVSGYFPTRSLLSTGFVFSGAFLQNLLGFSLYYNGQFGSGYVDHRYGGEFRSSF